MDNLNKIKPYSMHQNIKNFITLDKSTSPYYNVNSPNPYFRKEKIMNKKDKLQEELKRYYALWRDYTSVYEEWAKTQGLSSNAVLVLYSFYDGEKNCTQKSICQKWCIPKQTVSTILKDFQKRGYLEMTAMPEDKRNKLIKLTDLGKKLTNDVIGKLHKKEIHVMEKMGLENMVDLNDNTERFIQLFQERDIEHHA